LGARAWLVVGANCCSNAGAGLTLPFLIVYLHRVRDIPLGRTGLTLSLVGAAGVVATPVAGWLADRIGASRAFALGELLMAAGIVGFVPVHGWRASLVPAATYGVAGGFTWSGYSALLAEVVRPERRDDVFGVSYALANAGIGAGALVGGLVVADGSPRSFAVVFVADAI